MGEDANVPAAGAPSLLVRLLLVPCVFGAVVGPVVLLMLLPPYAERLAERERAVRLRVSELATTPSGVTALVEARVAVEQPGAGTGTVAHERFERGSKGGRRLVGSARPAIVIEEGEHRAQLEAERYRLEEVGPVIGFDIDSADEVTLAVRRGDVITAFGVTGERRGDTPVFGARAVLLGPADAALDGLRLTVSRLRLMGWGGLVLGLPAVAYLIVQRRRRAAAAQHA